MYRPTSLITLLLLCAQFVLAQSTYILNGAAQQKSCNCYQLTADAGNQSDTAWNRNKINLTNSFVYTFDVNLGCKDQNGADGIAFILQTQGTSLGATGQGIGFAGVSPSVGIIIDTWQNNNENDPPYDHVGIQMNGVSDHASPNNLAGPVAASPASDNIEDCQWHIFKISWDAVAMVIDVEIDGVNRVTLQKDIVADIFNGDPNVFWGFAGSTGGSSNVQQFCAALRPQFAAGQSVFCEGTPVQLYDNSSSFGSITRWFWDLGDGSTFTVKDPPIHNYAPGVYKVKLVIQDNSGCISDTLNQTVTVGTYPLVDFTDPPLICEDNSITFTDLSTTRVGTINRWAWDFGNGGTSTRPTSTVTYNNAGNYTVALTVTTIEGCSSSDSKVMEVAPSPSVSAIRSAANCLGATTFLSAENLSPLIPFNRWIWDLGNGDTTYEKDPIYTYPAGGNYVAKAFLESDKGCLSLPAPVDVRIVDVNAYAGRDTLIAIGQPLQLNGSGSTTFTWSPADGLSNPYIANPVAILSADQTYILTSTSPDGCMDRDTINIKAYKGPEFWVPSGFTPNNDGINDMFKPIAAGIPALDYLRIFDRWGGEVFYTRQLSVGWDGTRNGKPLPIGTYIWAISGKDYLGNPVSRKGTITLIR